ncbi:methionine synthase [Pseudonocardia sp. T1-2H]|uniref:methionine synthase n=1 Tax=Pseudonocardia sp. T1-2H TaxID=3128899 RepID=UPI0031012440
MPSPPRSPRQVSAGWRRGDRAPGAPLRGDRGARARGHRAGRALVTRRRDGPRSAPRHGSARGRGDRRRRAPAAAAPARFPARGVGADPIGRTAALLVDLAVEVVPSGWRVTARPGKDHRRAVDLLRRDVDAFDEACDGPRPAWVKVQAVGPWSLAAGIETMSGHRILTDRGAVREFSASLAEGLRGHVAEVAARTGARVLVQLDEPQLPEVLAGLLPTASGYGTVRSVSEQDAADGLRELISAIGAPVVVRCGADRPPLDLLSDVGAVALAVDATRRSISGATAVPAALDAIGRIWDTGMPLFLGMVPARPMERTPEIKDLAQRAFDLADRLGFARVRLAELAVPTPNTGLANATPDWARTAMELCRRIGQAFTDPE